MQQAQGNGQTELFQGSSYQHKKFCASSPARICQQVTFPQEETILWGIKRADTIFNCETCHPI